MAVGSVLVTRISWSWKCDVFKYLY